MEAVGQLAGRFPPALSGPADELWQRELWHLDQTHGTTQRPSSVYRASVIPLHVRSDNRGTKGAGGKWHLLLAHRLVGRSICAEQGSGEQETARTRAPTTARPGRADVLRLRPAILTKPLRLGRNGSSGRPAQACKI